MGAAHATPSLISFQPSMGVDTYGKFPSNKHMLKYFVCYLLDSLNPTWRKADVRHILPPPPSCFHNGGDTMNVVRENILQKCHSDGDIGDEREKMALELTPTLHLSVSNLRLGRQW